MIKAVFFDFDGVLTTDKDAGTSICKAVESLFGIRFESALIAYRNSNSWDLCRGDISLDEFWEIFYGLLRDIGLSIDFAKFKDARKEMYLNTPIDLRMLELAKKVKDVGFKIGIITDNNSERVSTILLDKVHIEFDFILVSEELKMLKVDPELFSMVKGRYGNSVFIDNNKKNCEVASASGIDGIYFDDGLRDYTSLEQSLRRKGVNI